MKELLFLIFILPLSLIKAQLFTQYSYFGKAKYSTDLKPLYIQSWIYDTITVRVGNDLGSAGYMINTATVTDNLKLIPNKQIMNDSSRGIVTGTVGDWITDVDLLASNGDSSLALNAKGGSVFYNKELEKEKYYKFKLEHREGADEIQELNGTFDIDANWSKNSNWSINNGVAIADGSKNTSISQNKNFISGEWYYVRFEIKEITQGVLLSRIGSGNTFFEFNNLGFHSYKMRNQGAYQNLYFSSKNYFKGKIDNVSVYELADSAQTVFGNEIQVKYNGQTIDTTEASATDWQAKEFEVKGEGGGDDWVRFDGVDDYAEVDFDFANAYPDSFSVVWSGYIEDVNNFHALVSNGDAFGGSQGWSVNVYKEKVYFDHFCNNNRASNISSRVLKVGYNSIIATYMQHKTYIYINENYSQYQDNSSLGSNITNNSNFKMKLGVARVNNFEYKGSIHSVAFYDRVLDSLEIDSLNRGCSIQGAVLDLNGSNITETTWHDASGNGNDATLVGATHIHNPHLELVSSDTAITDIRVSLEEENYKKAVYDSTSFKFLVNRSEVGSYKDTISFDATSVNDVVSALDYEVIPTSNILLKPENLVATSVNGGISINWDDLNEEDTLTYKGFTDQPYLNWKKQGNVSFGATEDYMQIGRSSGTNVWGSAYRDYKVSGNRSYKIKTTAYKLSANSVWLVVKGLKADGSFDKYYHNEESTNNTTNFEANVENPTSPILRVYLQMRADTVGMSSYFEDYQFIATDASYDRAEVQYLSYYNNYPASEWRTLGELSDGSNTYFHFASNFNDTTLFAYRVRFIKDIYASSWSNVDTANYIYIPPPPSTLKADYFVSASGISTFSNATSVDSPMNISTLIANKNNLISGDTVAFVGVIKGENVLDGFPSGLTFVGDSSCLITGMDFLPSWNNPSKWQSLGNGVWDYVDDLNYGVHRVWFGKNGTFKEYPNKMPDDFGKDSLHSKYGHIYRWYTPRSTNSETTTLRVWTEDGSNPATFYDSIKIVAGYARNSYDAIFNVRNTNGLTIRNMVFEGGAYSSLGFDNCDNVICDNIVVKNYQAMYMGAIYLRSSDNFELKNSMVKSGMREMDTGRRQNHQRGRHAIDILCDSDNAKIHHNRLEDGGLALVRIYTASNASGSADSARIYENIMSGYGVEYARAISISSDHGTYIPTGTKVYNNLIEGMTISSYLSGKDDYFYFNVVKDHYNSLDSIADHGTWNDASDQEMFSGTVSPCFGRGVKYIFNNTFINVGCEFMKFTGTQSSNNAEFHLINNLFLNLSKKYPNSITGNRDDHFFRNSNYKFKIVNNYSYNDDTNALAKVISTPESPYYHTYSEFESSESVSEANQIASGNVQDGVNNNLNAILYNWKSNDFALKSSNTLPTSGISISNMIDSHIDRDGNAVSISNPLVGAIQKRK